MQASGKALLVSTVDGRAVFDFGARQAHNMDATVYGERAVYIGGASSTSNVMVGKKFWKNVDGTMAHSWGMFYKYEYEALSRYAEIQQYFL